MVIAKVSPAELAKALPREIAGFRMSGPFRPNSVLVYNPPAAGEASDLNNKFAAGAADYVSADGEKLLVELIRFERDSDAYSLVTRLADRDRQGRDLQLTRQVGTTTYVLPGRIAFFKGPSMVIVSGYGKGSNESGNVIKLASALAETLPQGEGDVPILVKHLPEWESVQAKVVYLAGFRSLKELVPNQPILEAVTSEGDADAVRATYGNAQFLLVEFNTPQLAGDNDRAITAKLTELRQQGQPVPTSYRKVGNYSVFVFNAGSEAEAENLINQVEYAQMVTWLGNNPYLLEQAQKDYYETTAGVLVAVVKASGLSLVACLGLGGLIGAVLFNRRRAQQRAAEAYSDAGGMLRLNIDNITPQSDSAKLLGP